ncbi:rhodanese-like domain-containing protein [Microlunatus lacustris]
MTSHGINLPLFFSEQTRKDKTMSISTPPTPDTVDATTVIDWSKDPDAVTIIDVRTPAEFETAHIAGSYNVPLDLLGEHAAQFAARLDREVVLVCQSGTRATQARQRLAGVGAQNLHILEGGVPGFTAAGGEIVRGQARWALDRQVRLAAGSLVLASIVASLRLPALRFVAGGIGAGLTWSAVSNTCAMGNLLGRLPYNQGPAAPNASDILDRLPQLQSAA